MRYTGPIEKKVDTRTMCAESTLALVSGGPDLRYKNKAALSAHSTYGRNSFTKTGASDQYTALMLKF